MKMRKSLVLASIAGGLCFATSALAQQVVYDNTANASGFYWGGFLDEGITNSQEAGDWVDLGGQSRELIEIRVSIFNPTASGAGTADTRVRIYNVDGPPVGPATGSPQTVLFDETLSALPHPAGAVTDIVVPINNVTVPESIAWTLEMTNRTGSTGAIGPLLYGPPIVGDSPDWFFRDEGTGWIVSWFGGYPANPYAAFFADITASGTVVFGACCLPDGTCDDQMTQAGCALAFGVYHGDNSQCGNVFCDDPGACCLSNGDCIMSNDAFCTATGGSFAGIGVDCPTANCPQPGACCISPDHCILSSADQCTTAGGQFHGAGTVCDDANPPCSVEPILLSNGPLSTGEFTQGTFLQAPTGTTWSESQMTPECTNNTWGYGISGGVRIADDFTVPGTEGWNVQTIEVFGYTTRPNGSHPPAPTDIVGATLQIWDGPPWLTTSTVVWGDTTTNVLDSSTFADIYRVLWNQPDPATSMNDRPIFRNVLNVDTHLPPGTYWLDFALDSATGTTPWAPPVTVIGTNSHDGANAVQFSPSENAWGRMFDNCTPPNWLDFPFVITGQEGPGLECYPDCDGNGVLNINDFLCFIDEFAVQSPYADCNNDGLFNINDFLCFIDEFAVGCP